MSETTLTFELFAELFQTGVAGLFLYLLATGKLIPASVVDKMFDRFNERESKLAKETSDQILAGMTAAIRALVVEIWPELKKLIK